MKILIVSIIYLCLGVAIAVAILHNSNNSWWIKLNDCIRLTAAIGFLWGFTLYVVGIPWFDDVFTKKDQQS